MSIELNPLCRRQSVVIALTTHGYQISPIVTEGFYGKQQIDRSRNN